MFLKLLRLCDEIYLIQGFVWPFLIVLAGIVSTRQGRQLEELKNAVPAPASAPSGRRRGSKTPEPTDTPESVLRRLPKLEPINCVHCGASVLLRTGNAFCPSCRQQGPLPSYYTQALTLKESAAGLVRNAVWHWRIAQVITNPFTRLVFVVMLLAQPVILTFTVISFSELRGSPTWADRFVNSIGTVPGVLFAGLSFLATILGLVFFGMLIGLSRELRGGLPKKPVLDPTIHAHETANCQACGGGIEYEAGDFACLCRYCNVENLRVQFVQRAKAQSEKQRTKTQSALFGAMEIQEDFVSTAFTISLVLFVIALLVLVCVAAGGYIK